MDERLKIPEEWINIGDANPERHGGIFVRWKGDMWHIIQSRHFADLPKGISDQEHMFEHMWMEPMDIFENGEDIYGGLDPWAKKQLESFNNCPFGLELVNDPSLLPEDESHEDFINWVLDNHANWLITSLCYAYTSYCGGYDTDFDSDYWGYLENCGIEESEF